MSYTAEERSKAVKNLTLSIVLLVVGIVIGLMFLDEIWLGIVFGWGMAGTVWGWLITRTWFGPNVQQNTYQSPSGILDHNAFFKSFRGFMKIFCAVVVGIFALPGGIIKSIVILASKKPSDTVNVSGE
jgi:hypothetical protein